MKEVALSMDLKDRCTHLVGLKDQDANLKSGLFVVPVGKHYGVVL